LTLISLRTPLMTRTTPMTNFMMNQITHFFHHSRPLMTTLEVPLTHLLPQDQVPWLFKPGTASS
jgi:hypothetical protein